MPPSSRPTRKTFSENLVDFLVTVGLLALAAGAGYEHAWKTGAMILIVCAYFQRLRRRWDVVGSPTLWERLSGFYREVRQDLDARREAERRERQERLGLASHAPSESQ